MSRQNSRELTPRFDGKLIFNESDVPYDVLACLFLAQRSHKAWKINETSNTTIAAPTFASGGHLFVGRCSILRYIAKNSPGLNLYGRLEDDLFSEAQVDQWLEFGLSLNDNNFNASLQRLNNHLQLRTFLVEHQLTIADLAVWSSYRSFGRQIDNQYVHVNRWMKLMEAQMGVAQVASKYPAKVKKAAPNKPSSDAAPAKSRMGAVGNWDKMKLPGAEQGKVVTRFPPEPSGYLHMGHVKAALLNDHYARAYGGKMILRLDDTNPSKEKDEYVVNILRDLKTLGVVPDLVSYTSDYFPQLLQYADQMIKQGKLYVDNTDNETIKDQRMKGIESSARSNTVEDNLRLFEEMKKGSAEGKKCVVRAKIDMQNKNKALRDPNMLRCLDAEHHRTGTQYKVYPLYDFAVPIVDSLQGVTHALRSSEFHDRNPLYTWVAENAGLRAPSIQDFSRLNFQYELMSKRKLQWFVDNKIVDDWNDPRFPTVQGVLRRGLTIEALREFVGAQAASKNVTLMEPEKLWAVNRKIIDPVVPRHTALYADGICKVVLSDGPTAPQYKRVSLHPKTEEYGHKIATLTKTILLDAEDVLDVKEGEEVTLRNWGNMIVDKFTKRDDKGRIVEMSAHLHLDGNFKTTKLKLTWLPDIEDHFPVELRTVGNLITKPKLEKDDNFLDFVNPNTLTIVQAIADTNMRLLKKGDMLQIERRGYFIVDRPYVAGKSPMILINIPDGHVAKVGFRSQPKDAKDAQQKQTSKKA